MTSKKAAWSTQEMSYLADNYAHMTAEEISSVLGRSVISIRNRVQKLKLGKFQRYHVAAGSRFGKLVVIEKTNEKNKDGKYLYLCQCDCGNQTKVPSRSLGRKTTKSCGCISRELAKKLNKKPDGESDFNYLYQILLNNAIRREIDFSLTREEHKQLITKACSYCGVEPKLFKRYKKINPERQLIKVNGVDRIDSSKGYHFDNCTACCVKCNNAKMAMSVDEFKNWVKQTYKFLFNV